MSARPRSGATVPDPRRLRRPRRGRAAATLAVAALALGGCNLLRGPDAPRETYDIIAPANAAPSVATRAQILVKEPTALRAYDTDRIVLKPSPRVITYIADAQWLDTAPKLIQARLVEVFENTGRTGATARPGDGLVIDFQLVPSLRRFEIIEDENAAILELSIKLLTDKTGLVRSTRIFTARAPVDEATSDGYVRALDNAFDAASREIVEWVLSSI